MNSTQFNHLSRLCHRLGILIQLLVLWTTVGPLATQAGFIDGKDKDEEETSCSHSWGNQYLTNEPLTSLIPLEIQHKPSSKTYTTTPLLPEYVGEEMGESLYWNHLHGPAMEIEPMEMEQRGWRNEEGGFAEEEWFPGHKTYVTYLSPDESKACLVTIQDGRILDAQGHPVNSGPHGLIFVMDNYGRFFIRQASDPRDLYHSSLLHGRPVAAAGTMVIENGILKKIDDESGHYKPRRPFILQALERLKELGIDYPFTTQYFSPEPGQ